jgi:penicillin-insensitive murein DD-endopeptidase
VPERRAPVTSTRGHAPRARRAAAVVLFAVFLSAGSATADSESVGTPAHGALRGGVSMPVAGDGFVTYSRLGNGLGRQYVHSRVRDTLVDAFAALHAARPERTFVLGETGFEKGGPFRPHKSHQNGLSVDVFMPVRDRGGRVALMPTAPWQTFGYGLEFDAKGDGDGLSIDFPSLAELILELERQAPRHGLALDRIIVAPEYVDRVIGADKSEAMAQLGTRLQRRPAWVRHDEHVHVDFRVLGLSTNR